MPLFDAHSHLPARCPGDGGRVAVCGTREGDWEAVLAHGASVPSVLPMIGLHPWFVHDAQPGWEARLDACLRRHRVGVGECGLDFSRKDADRKAQEAAFRIQLRLARSHRRPAVIHAVRCWGRLLAILQEEGPPPGALVHAFGGSPEVARDLQEMGLYLSFSPALLDPQRKPLREAFRRVAADRLLLESDGAPDLVSLVRSAAGLRGEPPEELVRQTWENGLACFKELIG